MREVEFVFIAPASSLLRMPVHIEQHSMKIILYAKGRSPISEAGLKSKLYHIMTINHDKIVSYNTVMSLLMVSYNVV